VEENIQYKAFKFSLKPTEEQKVLLSKHFGCNRFIYNHFLKEKQDHYLKNKETLNFNNCCSGVVKLKKEFEWLKEVNSQTLIQSLHNLETAYGNFFAKRTKFPNYKSKKTNRHSFRVPQHFILKSQDLIKIPKFKEGIKYQKHREIKGKIKSLTISQNPSGKYFVSFLCEIPKHKPLKKTNKSIGIDLGLKDFLITSEDKRVPNQKHLKTYANKLSKKQKHLSRKSKGSKRRELARLKVAKVHEKITNSRTDQQHKVSRFLVENYDLIAIEDLNVKGMMANHKLANAISDVAWSSFVTKLKYKAEWYGKEVFVIDRFFPSSKTCNSCGHIYKNLSLKERNWKCENCNTTHDRDVNAAKNILQRALTIKSSGTDDYRHGVEISPKTTKVVKGINCEVSKKRVYKLNPKPIGL